MVPLIVIAVIILVGLARTVRIVPQARARIVERLGRHPGFEPRIEDLYALPAALGLHSL